jgi:hypothetical protein
LSLNPEITYMASKAVINFENLCRTIVSAS